MKIAVLDGKNTIGGSKILIDSGDTKIFLDFGKNFAKWGNYFEEFLQPRASIGIVHDLWRLDLIPHYSDIYRKDLLLNDFVEETGKNNSLNVDAVLLSHAHIDHSGYIPLLKEDIPIYTSLITKRMLNVMQNVGKSDIFSQYVDIKRRKEDEDLYGNRVLKSRTKKDGNNTCSRKFVVESEGKIGKIEYKFYPVDHSIPGASAILLNVNGVKIAYTGDLRFHGKNKQNSYDFVSSMKEIKPDILISEGTRVTEEYYEMWKNADQNKYTSEEDVYNISLDTVKNNKGRLIIADFGARNVERLATFLKIAKETDRKLVTMPEDMYMLYVLSSYYNDDYTGGMPEAKELLDDDNLYFFASKRLTIPAWTKKDSDFYTSFHHKSVKVQDIQKNKGDYIICFSFWNMVHLLDLNLDDGVYIYSSSEAYTEEQAIDMNRLLNWIEYFKLIPYGIKRGNSNPEFDKRYHSSGHSSIFDIVKMIEEVNPRILIPVHTEHCEVFEYIFSSKMEVVKGNEYIL